jgi:hypothetical protein
LWEICIKYRGFAFCERNSLLREWKHEMYRLWLKYDGWYVGCGIIASCWYRHWMWVRGQLHEMRAASFIFGSYWQVASKYRRQVIMHVSVCQTVNGLTDRLAGK